MGGGGMDNAAIPMEGGGRGTVGVARGYLNNTNQNSNPDSGNLMVCDDDGDEDNGTVNKTANR